MNGKQLKNSILQWAIQGKLVPQDPNDEPASVLLEKIRTEKARLIKEGKIKKDKNESFIFRGDDNSYYEKFLATGEVKCIDDEIPFEIPTTWEWVRLSNISIIQEGPGIRSFQYMPSGIQLLTVTNILEGKVDMKKQTKFISEQEYHDKYIHFTLKQGDIVCACSGGSWGKSALFNVEGAPVILNTSTLRLRYFSDLGCNQYLYHITKSSFFKNQLAEQLSGMQPNFGYTHYSKILLPLPPLREQKCISELIEQILPYIFKYNSAQEILNKLNNEISIKLKKSILQEAIQGKLVPQIAEEGTAEELLKLIKQEKQHLVKEGKLKKSTLSDSVIFRGDDNKYYEQIGRKCLDITELIPFEIPENWVWTKMGQIGDWGAGSTPQRGNANYYNGNILWLKTGELNNEIVYDTEEKITPKALQDCSLRINKIGDVLIAMYGATIGKLAIVGKELTTNQACCGCTPYLIYNWYLFYFLMASRDSFIKKGEGGAQPNISRVKLIEYLIPLPPLKEQYRIVAQIEKLFEQLR